MKKCSSDQVIKILYIIAIAVITLPKPAFCQEPIIDSDLITWSMAVSPGQQVKVRLPLDIRSGDRITGTVVEEPKKNTGAAAATATLEGVVIEINGKKTNIKNRLISFLVPAGAASLPFLLKNAAGEIIEHGQIPIGIETAAGNRRPLNGGNFVSDRICQPGEPLTINGNFDGNSSNTKVTLNNIPCEIIAESNRMTAVQVPLDATAGPSTVTVNENNLNGENRVNVLTLTLEAKKTSLLRGESTRLKVKVSGLEGLETEKQDIKLKLENRSPEIIRIVDEKGNVVSKNINDGSVKKGKYEYTTRVISKTTGAFTITGKITTVEKDDCQLAYEKECESINKQEKEAYEKSKNSGNGVPVADPQKIADIIKALRDKCIEDFIKCRKNK